MSYTLMLGIAVIVAFAIWFFTIGYSTLFDWWAKLVIILAAAWMIAFLVETDNENREIHCTIVPEAKDCQK